MKRDNDDLSKRSAEAVIERWEHLQAQTIAATEQVLRYLVFTNSGGAVAMLAFVGAFPGILNIGGTMCALVFFAAGVISAGALMVFRLHRLEFLLTRWGRDAEIYYSGNMTLGDLCSRDAARCKSNVGYIAYVLGYLSFFSFIAGAIGGSHALLRASELRQAATPPSPPSAASTAPAPAAR